MGKKILGMLSKHFKPIKDYKYEPNKPSHKWTNKTVIKEFQKEMQPLTKAVTELLKVCIFNQNILVKILRRLAYMIILQ